MIKLSKLLNTSLLIRSINGTRFNNYSTACIPQFNFDGNEEILENYLEKIVLIGLNIPHNKNLLSESALDKLIVSFKKFNENSGLTVAILHGCGGNFCTGIDNGLKCREKAEELIKVLEKLNKPLIGSLNGYTQNFGFQLAVMCDLIAIEHTAMVGLGSRCSRTYVPDIICKRLVSIIGISKTMEMILTNCNWSGEQAKIAGLVNKSVECGTALGQAICWAQSISLASLDSIMADKLNILSLVGGEKNK